MFFKKYGEPDGNLVSINNEIKSLQEIFKVKLEATEKVICTKMNSVEKSMHETKAVIDKHVEWHDNITRNIAGKTIKCLMVIAGLGCVVALIWGIKDGVLLKLIGKLL
jgi:hypothetical protein